MKTHTKGNVIVEEIKVGDIHYEYDYGMGIKCEVITLPSLNESGQYEWQSRNVNTDKIIDYLIEVHFLGQFFSFGLRICWEVVS